MKYLKKILLNIIHILGIRNKNAIFLLTLFFSVLSFIIILGWILIPNLTLLLNGGSINFTPNDILLFACSFILCALLYVTKKINKKYIKIFALIFAICLSCVCLYQVIVFVIEIIELYAEGFLRALLESIR